MRFGDSRESRWKWFNGLGVMRKWIYIENGVKSNILAKHNMVNRFTKCVSRFKQIKDKHEGYEDWYASGQKWIDSRDPRWRLKRFKLIWIDSLISQRVPLIRLKQIWIDSMVIRLKNSWNDSPKVRDFLWRLKFVWIDSKALKESFTCKNGMQDTRNTWDTMRHGLLSTLTWLYAILLRTK